MKSFEFLDHTADVKFRAYGKDYLELFSNASKAMFDVMVRNDRVKISTVVRLNFIEKELSYALLTLLEELLYKSEEQSLVFSDFKLFIDEKPDGFHVSCEASGDHLSNYSDLGPEIKAVTRGEFEFGELESKGEKVKYCQVILDI